MKSVAEVESGLIILLRMTGCSIFACAFVLQTALGKQLWRVAQMLSERGREIVQAICANLLAFDSSWVQEDTLRPLLVGPPSITKTRLLCQLFQAGIIEEDGVNALRDAAKASKVISSKCGELFYYLLPSQHPNIFP